jgi:hypothetical protein
MNQLKTESHKSERQSIEQFLLDFANGDVPETPDLTNLFDQLCLRTDALLSRGSMARSAINSAKHDQERCGLAGTNRAFDSTVG